MLEAGGAVDSENFREVAIHEHNVRSGWGNFLKRLFGAAAGADATDPGRTGEPLLSLPPQLGVIVNQRDLGVWACLSSPRGARFALHIGQHTKTRSRAENILFSGLFSARNDFSTIPQKGYCRGASKVSRRGNLNATVVPFPVRLTSS